VLSGNPDEPATFLLAQTIDPTDRFDAGGTITAGNLTLFAVLLNLQDDLREAGTLDGGLMILPRRSARMGMTWRFLD